MSETDNTDEKDTIEQVLERAQCLPLDDYDPLVDHPPDTTPQLHYHGDETAIVMSDVGTGQEAVDSGRWILMERGEGQ